MPFKSKKELGGAVDKNINKLGRLKRENAPTNRELREREFMSLLRKLKPLVADSINTAANIMKNKEALDSNRLKAAIILLDNYKEMVEDVYDNEIAEEVGEEVQQPNTPVFSLKVINTDTPEDKTGKKK